MAGMKSYSMDLRGRIVESVKDGRSMAETARRYKVSRWTVYRYVKAGRGGDLAPKPRGRRAKRFTDEALRREVESRPSATLEALGKALGVNRASIWKRLRQLKITRKKNS